MMRAFSGTSLRTVGSKKLPWLPMRLPPASSLAPLSCASATNASMALMRRGLASAPMRLSGSRPSPTLVLLAGGGQRLVEVAPRGMTQFADGFAGVHDLLGLGPGGLDPIAVDVVLEGRAHARYLSAGEGGRWPE